MKVKCELCGMERSTTNDDAMVVHAGSGNVSMIMGADRKWYCHGGYGCYDENVKKETPHA